MNFACRVSRTRQKACDPCRGRHALALDTIELRLQIYGNFWRRGVIRPLSGTPRPSLKKAHNKSRYSSSNGKTRSIIGDSSFSTYNRVWSKLEFTIETRFMITRVAWKTAMNSTRHGSIVLPVFWWHIYLRPAPRDGLQAKACRVTPPPCFDRVQ